MGIPYGRRVIFVEPLDLFRLSEYNYSGFLYCDLRGVCYEWIYYSPGSCCKVGNHFPEQVQILCKSNRIDGAYSHE